jgi:hypothetical protein
MSRQVYLLGLGIMLVALAFVFTQAILSDPVADNGWLPNLSLRRAQPTPQSVFDRLRAWRGW